MLITIIIAVTENALPEANDFALKRVCENILQLLTSF